MLTVHSFNLIDDASTALKIQNLPSTNQGMSNFNLTTHSTY